MRVSNRSRWFGLGLAAVLLGSGTLAAQQTAQRPQQQPRPSATVNLIHAYQIDRYQAIQHLVEGLRADPRNLADWIILGELAHEVALDAPPELAAGYFRLAREGFENASKLAPGNAELRTTAQLMRDQQTRVEQGQQPVRPRRDTSPTAARPEPRRVLPRGAYPYSLYYRPYQSPPGQFDQYTRAYGPSANWPGQATPPMTLRQYTQQLPRVLANEAIPRISPRLAPGSAPGVPAPGAAPSPPGAPAPGPLRPGTTAPGILPR